MRKEKRALTNKIQQNLLKFKLKVTNECITSRSGFLVFVKLAEGIGLAKLIHSLFGRPGSNRGIRAYDYVMSILLMLIGGGKYLEDIRQIREDKGVREVCGIKKVPSSDGIARFLRKRENKKKVKKVIEYLNREIIKRSKREEFTLDVDATLLSTEKNKAEMTYKGFYGNSVLLGFLPEVDLCICDEYRTGKTHAGKNILEQIKYTNEFLLRINKKLKYFRSDSAGYNSEVINYCFEKGIKFSITADLDSSVKEAIKTIPKDEFKALYDKDGNYAGREYTTIVHCMNKTKEAFTLIVQRWEEGREGYLFDEFKYRYYVIATNDFEKSP